MKLHRWRSTPELWAKLEPLARQMRREPTSAENLLWRQLRRWQVAGAKFRRQVVIDRFIVDFYAAREWLVVEVDGEYHQYTAAQDAVRQEFLESLGLRVLRVSNQDVMENLEGVVMWIGRAVREERARRAKRVSEK